MKRPIAKLEGAVLDREAITDFATLLADDVIARAEEISTKQELDQIDDHDELLRSSYGLSDHDVWVVVPIVVRSEVASDKPNNGKLIVTTLVHEDTGEPTIEVAINGSYQWSKLGELRDSLAQDLIKVLLRELPIALSLRVSDESSTFVQDVADEAVARAEAFRQEQRDGNPTRDMVLDHVRAGEFFKSMAGMKLRDRATTLKLVYSSLADTGLV